MPPKTDADSLRVGTAIKVACETHAGQIDKGGDPYAFHVFRVGMSLWPNVEATIVGFAHDAIEDSDLSVEEAFNYVSNELGLGIAFKVGKLTRRKGMPYETYIDSLIADDVCRRVKIADITDNMRPDRVIKATRRGHNMTPLLQRYEKALALLKRAEG